MVILLNPFAMKDIHYIELTHRAANGQENTHLIFEDKVGVVESIKEKTFTTARKYTAQVDGVARASAQQA